MTRLFPCGLAALIALAVTNVSGADKKKPAALPTVAGIVKSADATASTITLEGKKTKQGTEPEQTIAIAKDAKVVIDGKEAKLDQVKAGGVIQLTLTEDKKSATQAVVNGGLLYGVVKSVDAQAGSIILEGRKAKKGNEPDQTITVGKDARISVDGEAKTLADVKPGVTATLTLTVDRKTALALTVGGKKKG